MTQARACPDAADIRRLALGQTGESESTHLEEHLLCCDACVRRLQALPADDPLIAALRQARASATPAPRSDLVEKLLRRLREMKPAAGQETVPAETTGPSAPQAEAPGQQPALAPPQRPDEIGRLGGYRVLKELGRGGMGVVYQAEDERLKRLVALKAMLPNLAADDAARRRFLREAQAMAAVHHDHVVTIFQVDEAGGVPFLAMEFLEGMSLDQWLKAGRRATVPQVLRIGREAAEGLAAAHARGLIHRDVKPGNLWLDATHKGRVKVLDFGLARAGQEDVQLTRSGAILGTPAYMAPEQARGEKVDARGDLFSLGCVLYRLLTGAMPFTGDTITALLLALALDHPKPVQERNADCPAALSDLVMRLLEKDPAKRPQSAREVIQELQAVERPLATGQPLGMVSGVAAPAGVGKPGIVQAPPARLNPAPRPAAAGGKRRLGVVVAVAAAFLGAVLAAVVVIIRNSNGDKIAEIQIPPGGTVQVVDEGKKASAVAPTKESAEEAWVKQVAAMSTAKQLEAVAARLKELNPGFDGQLTPRVEGGVITGLQLSTEKVWDISPVRALAELRTLNCNGPGRDRKGLLADLSPLKGLKLKSLSCKFTQVSDLSPLRDMKLTDLDCSDTAVADLFPLKDMPLTFLKCDSTKVADLSPLQGMKLTSLECGETQVADLSPLKDMPLTFLGVKATHVSDLSPLKGMPLTFLQTGQTQVSDLTPLKDMKSLTTLMCYQANVTDLSPLKDVPLQWLVCDLNPERDAKSLRLIKTLLRVNDKPMAEFWKEVEARKGTLLPSPASSR